MRISKARIKSFKEAILKADGKVFSIHLATEPCDFLELEKTVNLMLLAWKTRFFIKDSVLKKYTLGILRRFLISYDSETETFEPYFYVICVCPNNVETEDFKNRVFIKWHAAWVKTLGSYEEAEISNSFIAELKYTEEDIAAELERFRSLNHESFDEDSLFDIKNKLEQRNLVSMTGIFKEAGREKRQEKEASGKQLTEIKSKIKTKKQKKRERNKKLAKN